MTDPVKDAGTVIVAGFGAGAMPDVLASAARAGALGGVILFKRNLAGKAPIEIARQNAELAAPFGDLAPLIAVDQEGGRVARLGPPVIALPPMRRLGAIDDVTLTRRAGAALGRQLAALGFDLDFAPVLDVATNPANQVIGDRAFSDRAEVVARHGIAFAQGLESACILACGKHFPGHGDTVEDSHFELPALPHALERLMAVELLPFREAAPSVGSIMTAHIVFRALDPDRPATLSRRVITGLLRETLGYRGLIVSDDLEMKAIASHFSVGEAACGAVDAGCDAVLICSRPALFEEAREALAERAGADSVFGERLAEAARRVREVRSRLRVAPLLEEVALRAALDDEEAREVMRALGG